MNLKCSNITVIIINYQLIWKKYVDIFDLSYFCIMVCPVTSGKMQASVQVSRFGGAKTFFEGKIFVLLYV